MLHYESLILMTSQTIFALLDYSAILVIECSNQTTDLQDLW